MTTPLFQNPDGASPQAQAVLAYIRQFSDGFGNWQKEFGRYEADPRVSRWENCREQGYVVWMRGEPSSGRQINIAFFEHRNSDNICAIEWEQSTINAPSLDTADFGGKVYKDKWDVSHTVKVGQASDMAEWIVDRLAAFWESSKATAEEVRAANRVRFSRKEG